MKKFVSMFLALVMCLSLAVPAFAAEEETETANEPVVQTEVETEITDEAAVQAAGCLHTDYKVEHYYEIDPNNYTASGHARDYIESYTCTTCNKDLGSKVLSTSFVAHRMRVTEFGLDMGINGEDVITYLHKCNQCNYSFISTEK